MFSWKPFGSLLDAFWSALATSGRLLGGSWRLLGAFLISYGSSGRLPGSHVGDLGGCWTHLGTSWSRLGASWRGLGSFWEPLRSILETFRGCLGMILELGQRFRSNLLKY